MRQFGELEAAIMHLVWRMDQPVTVRAVHEALQPNRRLAYTTVMTVMDNLHGKGALTRQRDGRAYQYRPTHSRDEYSALIMTEALESSHDHTAALLHFIERMDPDEVAELRRALNVAEGGPRG